METHFPHSRMASRSESPAQPVRAQKLHDLFGKAGSADNAISRPARGRLGLQLLLRELRGTENDLAKQLNAYQRVGEHEEAKTIEKLLKKNSAQLETLKNRRNGYIGHDLRKRWTTAKLTFKQLLGQGHLDTESDFGDADVVIKDESDDEAIVFQPVPEWYVTRYTACTRDIVKAVALQISLDEPVAVLDHDGGSWRSTLEIKARGEQRQTWHAHEEAMKSQYQKTNVEDHMMITILAAQKIVFDSQASRENFLLTTLDELREALGAGQQLRIGYSEITCIQTGIWTLASTEYWLMFKNGKSWELPRWTPGGHLRIQNSWGKSVIYVDFGHRSFRTESVELPAYASLDLVWYQATCDEMGFQVKVGIVFAGSGHMNVHFPARPLIAADGKCTELPNEADKIVFAAKFEGFTR